MMDRQDWLAERFEANRPQLTAVAFRMLGSMSEADDAVQEGWLRLSRADTSAVENLAGWLTTVVARVCLDMLRARSSRREEPMDEAFVEPIASPTGDPEHEALMADSIGSALLIVLDTLAPVERVAFVLHDMFGLPFDAIAPIVGRSPAAARQLASRARRRVQGAGGDGDADPRRKRRIVDAFLAASRGGDFKGLLAVLDPNVVLRADAASIRIGATREVRGAAAVAQTFAGRARDARLALLDGEPGLAWAPGGRLRVAFGFTLEHGKIVGIEMMADRERLTALDVQLGGD
jgi:RNA polymerase sigma factor (sigma-70 family)